MTPDQAWREIAAGRADAVLAALEAGAMRDDLSGWREVAEAVGAGPIPPPRVDAVAPPEGQAPGVGDISRFLHLFQGREDVHARQWASEGRGGYAPVRAPLTPALLRDHLGGRQTLGVYPHRLDGTVVWLALDLDIRRRALERARASRDLWADLRRRVHAAGLRAQAALRELGWPCLLEDSGQKGRHLWCFLEQPVSGTLAHRAAVALAHHVGIEDVDLSIEAFPKQRAPRDGGLGSLVKLPLGLHRVSGRWSVLLDAKGAPTDTPWRLLREVGTVKRDALLDLIGRSRPANPASQPSSAPERADAPADQDRLKGILTGCAVLRAIARRARAERRLSHDDRVVLRHSVGHLEAGVAWLDELLGGCPETPPQELGGRPLRGNPISCARIRTRVPDVTASVACHCVFQDPTHYPSPVLHPPAAPPRLEAGPSVRIGLQQALARLPAKDPGDDAPLRVALREVIQRLGGELNVDGGTWRVADGELRFEAT